MDIKVRCADFMNIILISYLAILTLVQQSIDYSEKGSVDIVQLCISDELLERNSQWVNEWFQVKKATEPNKDQVPKIYQICCSASW